MAKKAQPTHKQHTVPQLYLRPFADEKERFWAYDKTDGRIFQLRVADAAQKHGFFSLPEFDGDRGAGAFAEEYFQTYEGPAARAIRDVLSRLRIGVYKVITDEARADLAYFLAVQYQRTQAARSRLEDLNKVFEKMATLWPDVPQLAGASPAPSGRELARDHLISGLHPEKIRQYADVLYNHVWGLFRNSTGVPLYTSDNPLTIQCQAPQPGMGVGIGSYGVEVSIPLSPTCSLSLLERKWALDHAPGFIVRDGQIWGGHIPDTVTFCRSLQVRDSHRFVYSDSKDDFALAEEICTAQPELRVPGRPRMIAMMGGEVIYGPDDHAWKDP